MCGNKVEDVTPDGVVVGGERLPARVVLWAAGVMASPAAQWLGLKADAHVAFLVGGRNRAVVLLQWAWAYLTYRRGSRLITGPLPGPVSRPGPAPA